MHAHEPAEFSQFVFYSFGFQSIKLRQLHRPQTVAVIKQKHGYIASAVWLVLDTLSQATCQLFKKYLPVYG